MTPRSRLAEVDALRGLIMCLMALDHANEFIARAHPTGEFWAGPFPEYASALPFLTRALTHLCAPGFFLLMGAGMALFAARRTAEGWSRTRIVRHYAIRGLVLVALNLFVENLAWFGGSAFAVARLRGVPAPAEVPLALPGGGGFPFLVCGVLTGLGMSMIVGSLLLGLRTRWVLAVSVAAMLATELFTPPIEAGATLYPVPLRLLLIPGHTGIAIVIYPLVPWLAIAAAGIAFGRMLEKDPARAVRIGLVIGLVAVVAASFLRAQGGFGNIRPPHMPAWIPFFNLVKYPPSLVFTLLTVGIDLTLLWVLARIGASRWPAAHPLLVFGRTPLFFYLAHLYLLAVMGLVIGPHGTGIPRMYPLWLLALLLLYPACRVFAGVRSRLAPESLLRMM